MNTNIKNIIIFDGENEFNKQQILADVNLSNKIKSYLILNSVYERYAEEINAQDGILYFKLEPFFVTIKNINGELSDKIFNQK